VWPRSTVTDATGRARFDGLPDGKAVIVAAGGRGVICTEAWAEAGGEEATLRLPVTARVRVRLAEPVPGHRVVSCAVYSLERADSDGRFDYKVASAEREGEEYVLRAPAERVMVRFRCTGGPERAWELDLSDGNEARVTYAFGPRPPTEIRVLDHRGEPVAGARISTLAGDRRIASTDREGRAAPGGRAPLGVIRLKVERRIGYPPQVTGPVDTSGPVLVRLGPTGRVAVSVFRDGSPVREGEVRIHSELGATGGWFAVGRIQATKVLYEVPVGARRVEYRREGGMPRFANVTVVEGRTAEVEIRLP
jgi:hypothetical protein